MIAQGDTIPKFSIADQTGKEKTFEPLGAFGEKKMYGKTVKGIIRLGGVKKRR